MDQAPSPIADEAHALMAGMPTPEAVRRVEDMLLQLPQVDLQTAMHVHAGLAARTIFIPAGTVLTGAETNLDNLCVLSGDITVTTDQGPKRLVGFHILPAAKGFKRMGVANADTWWTTIWRTDLTDIAAIEDEMTSESERLQTRTLALSGESHELIEGQTR